MPKEASGGKLRFSGDPAALTHWIGGRFPQLLGKSVIPAETGIQRFLRTDIALIEGANPDWDDLYEHLAGA